MSTYKILWLLVVGAALGAACSSSSPISTATSAPPTPIPSAATALPTIVLRFNSTPTPTHLPPLLAPTETPTSVSPLPQGTAGLPLPTPTIVIEAIATLGSCNFRLEVADEANERGRGLMARESMPIDQGMLFVFDFEQELNFWMRNTLIPLDIAYLNDALQVVDVQMMAPEHEILPDLLPFYTSAFPAKFALEVNSGVAAQCDITPGVTMALTYINE